MAAVSEVLQSFWQEVFLSLAGTIEPNVLLHSWYDLFAH